MLYNSLLLSEFCLQSASFFRGRIKWEMRAIALVIKTACLFIKFPWPADSEGGFTLSFLMLNVKLQGYKHPGFLQNEEAGWKHLTYSGVKMSESQKLFWTLLLQTPGCNLPQPLPLFQGLVHSWLCGRVDRASTSEAIDSDSISYRVKPKTIKIGIDSFPAWCSAIEGTVWRLRRVWWTGVLEVAWLEDRKVSSLPFDQGKLVNKM